MSYFIVPSISYQTNQKLQQQKQQKQKDKDKHHKRKRNRVKVIVVVVVVMKKINVIYLPPLQLQDLVNNWIQL